MPLPSTSELFSAFDARRLQLLILPTEKCNFRCTYCYERFEIGRMSPEIVDGVKSLIVRRAGNLNSLSIGWFGGEPLLAKQVVFDISQHAMSVTSRAGIKYGGAMTTNGYLLDTDTVDTLSEFGVRSFQISLDGPPEIHDSTRLRADGAGTFTRIWNNLLGIRESDLPVEITLRVHFMPATVSALAPLVDLINNDLANDSRFNVAFKAIRPLGGPNDAAMEKFRRGADIEAKRELESLVRYPHPDQSSGSPQICYAAKPNSLLIRADGRIGKCTVALYDEANTIGTLTEDGRVHIDSEKLRPWMRGFETLDSDQLGCPLQTLHGVAAPPARRSLPLLVKTSTG